MNKILTATMIALSITALSGCVSTEPVKYRADHSRAFNIAEAGDLITGIQDASVPRDQLTKLVDSKTFGAAYVLSSYISPSISGLSNWQGGLLSLANWAFGPKKHGARNSLIAWMPASEAGSPADAQAKLISHVKFSVESSLREMGAEFDLLYDKDSKLSYHFYKKEWGCPTWVNKVSDISDMCIIRVKVIEPYHAKAPLFITGVQGDAYAFTSGDATDFNYINVINGAASRTPQQVIYAKISEKLPAWSFIYIAPKTVTMENGDKVKFPYLLEKGKPELFVYPS